MVSFFAPILVSVAALSPQSSDPAVQPVAEPRQAVGSALGKGKYPWYDSQEDGVKPLSFPSDWNWSFVMCAEPTTATSSELRLAVDVPPQPAATSAREPTASRMNRLMEKAPFAAVSSRCLTRGQYSID